MLNPEFILIALFCVGFTLFPFGSASAQDDDNPLPPCPDSPNCVRSAYEFSADSSTVFSKAEETLEEMGVHSLEWSSDSTQINAVFRIPVFGWLDDVDIAIKPSQNRSTLYIRSASRVGYYDLGVNKRRVRKFIRILTQKITA